MGSTQNIPPIVKVGLSIPSDVNAIARPVDQIMDLLRRANSVAGAEREVEAALREALGNAVLHGNQQDRTKRVQLRVCFEPGAGAAFVVSDEGNGFDAGHLPDPSDEANLLSERGRGIFLMKHFMDEVQFEKGGAEVRMRKGSLHVPRGRHTARHHAPATHGLQKAG